MVSWRSAVKLAAAGALAAYPAYAWFANRRFESLDPRAAGAPGSFIEIDGHDIHYIDTGRGEPVVLVHGWNGSTFNFRYTIPELARRARVVAVDLLGFGYSARPRDADYSLTAQAERVRALMDRLGIARASVIGHSMGGGVALRLALAHPERVSRLVLADSVSVRRRTRGVRIGAAVAPLLPLLAPLTTHRRRFRERVLSSAVHDPALLTPEMMEGHFRPLRMRGHLRVLRQLVRDRRREPLVEPSSIRQPVLILWGEHDRWLSPSHGEELAALIPDARLLRVRGAAHLPLEEQPAWCNRELLKFLGLEKERTAVTETPAEASSTGTPAS
jgi:pimeloyl-ACP methyl ester carboxylesterase